jgi:alpha-glucosidase
MTPELFSRWIEAGVFFPIMRSHSDKKVTAHFPWLFGPDAQTAITKAIDLRYRLIPYYYSLAWQTHESGVPMMRPLLMEFPDDPKLADLSDQWMMGSGLMAAPVMQQGVTSRSVYLPKDKWFPFEGTAAVDGGQTLTVNAKFDEIPIYIRAGTILPLGPVVQNTDAMPGGPLDMQIYPGKDATFTLFEDDGESVQYLKGAFRKTTFSWNDSTHELSWTTEGNYTGSHAFKQMSVTLFDPAGKKSVKAALNSKGSVAFPST